MNALVECSVRGIDSAATPERVWGDPRRTRT